MAEVTTVVEPVAEMAAPVVAGTLDYKKVALVGAGVVGVGVLAAGTYYIIKKRKAKKAEVEVNPEPKEEDAKA